MAQIQLDEELLKELGLDNFSEEDKDAILASIAETLQLKIGVKLVQLLGETKLEEFNKLTEEGKGIDAMNYLKENVPNYEDIVKEELDALKSNIKDTSKSILDSANLPS